MKYKNKAETYVPSCLEFGKIFFRGLLTALFKLRTEMSALI